MKNRPPNFFSRIRGPLFKGVPWFLFPALLCGPQNARAGGQVVAWGNSPQSVVPPGLSNAIAVSAGWFHSVVLKSDGTVVAWGFNNNGQTNTPPGLSNVVAITGTD